MEPIVVSAGQLLTAIQRVEHAAAKDQARPVLATIRVEKLEGDEPGLRLVAADNYRIAWCDVHVDVEEFEPFLIQRDDLPLLKLWLKMQMGVFVLMETTDKHLTLRVTYDRVLTLRLFEGTFPNWTQVLPAGPQMVVALNPQYLADMGKAFSPRSRKYGAIPVSMHVRDPLKPVMFEFHDGGEIIMPVKATVSQTNELVPDATFESLVPPKPARKSRAKKEPTDAVS